MRDREELLAAALRHAHNLYLDQIGAQIAYMERVAGVLKVDLADDLDVLRKLRVAAEVSCRTLEEQLGGIQ